MDCLYLYPYSMLSPQPPQIHSWLSVLGRWALEQPHDDSWPSRQARDTEWTTPAAAMACAKPASRLPWKKKNQSGDRNKQTNKQTKEQTMSAVSTVLEPAPIAVQTSSVDGLIHVFVLWKQRHFPSEQKNKQSNQTRIRVRCQWKRLINRPYTITQTPTDVYRHNITSYIKYYVVSVIS